MISKEQLEVLSDIFSNAEREDKISIDFDYVTNSVNIRYDDIDEEWFNELISPHK